MSQPLALHRLQTLDLDIERHRTRIRDIATQLEQDAELRSAKAAVEAIQTALRPQETRINDLNLEIQTVSRQTKEFSDRLYGGSVSNPKELEDIQNKIAERKRRRTTLEDDLLETMIAVEELQEQLAGAEAHHSSVESAWTTEHAALSDESKQLKRELKALKAERADAESAVNAANLDLYQALRAEKRGQAVAVLQGEACSVCRVGQTSNIVQQIRQGDDIVRCSSCGRILVAV
jgi:predicted  nucleic acid-binding Zn-ribbon protein